MSTRSCPSTCRRARRRPQRSFSREQLFSSNGVRVDSVDLAEPSSLQVDPQTTKGHLVTLTFTFRDPAHSGARLALLWLARCFRYRCSARRRRGGCAGRRREFCRQCSGHRLITATEKAHGHVSAEVARCERAESAPARLRRRVGRFPLRSRQTSWRSAARLFKRRLSSQDLARPIRDTRWRHSPARQLEGRGW
jgi:hypothetical protein